MAQIKRAIISLSDKTGIIPFAKRLAGLGVELLSTGGTARALKEAGVPVVQIDDYTGFPEMMDGRVKTLNPRIHGGLLARRDHPEDIKAMAQNGIKPIDMVVVNLYPFEATIAKEGVSLEEVIENIDIGGPTMLRSAAKNHKWVTVVTDPADYDGVLKEIEKTGGVSEATNARLAVKVYARTADYDSTIDMYLSKRILKEEVLRLKFTDGVGLRYGENSHQQAVFYRDRRVTEPNLANAEQLHGKELSYNNIVDGEASLEAAKDLAPACGATVIKHTNPCGYATGATVAGALAAAWEGDIVSAFGSVITCTTTVDLAAAEVIKGRFVEILIAPGFTPEALEFLRSKSKDIRLLKIPALGSGTPEKTMYRHVVGGMLKQDRDRALWSKWATATTAQFPPAKKALAEFIWKACKWTKSNAIILGREYQPGFFQVVGMGAGQPNRIDSLRKLAVTKAEENLKRFHAAAGTQETQAAFLKREIAGLVLASDAFFPFADTIEVAAEYGIKYIVQPGGSKKDDEVIAACDRHGIAMVLTGTRHFYH
ncbi:MAG: bifunctional phosphoribosylaminoimidazolecarboxamide formyltransferase/IMP cyclohydrolase [Planctomycetota bacterium]